MAERATILIPDISGYTDFLTKTELVHSSHIINELLEAILAANSGEFVLSEVEGDARTCLRHWRTRASVSARCSSCDDSVAVEIDAPMLEVYQLVIDLDQRTRWLSAVERVDRPATTERIGMRHTCIFHGLTVEGIAVKSGIGDDDITYTEEGRIVEKDLPARASFVLKRLGERRTSLQFRAKWLCSPEPPREVTNAILAHYTRGLETIKTLCERP